MPLHEFHAARDLQALEIDAFLAQAETLAQLSQVPAWSAWTALLRDMRQAALEELAHCTLAEDFRYWQGVAHALAEIMERPGRIIATAGEHQRTEEADRRQFRPELRAIVGAGLDADGDV